MLRSLAHHAHRFVRELYRSLVAYGQLWMYLPKAEPRPQPLERVRPDLPLTPTERALEQQLLDLDTLS
ncbi:DUF6059 family protein [Streptomyces yaanensis]|uniref:DUF6059 family protein n=1 Tax=Streptomyces yaanensis TaxID=1142239 RepID=A0ABV7SH51_9ACTN|nr:DUF6059 family protein [Streptomyces sp. CGMCC 4.7035]WNB99358.1 DUF6059 family protein [Streptomyces sp. CGMCC 4.7035]